MEAPRSGVATMEQGEDDPSMFVDATDQEESFVLDVTAGSGDSHNDEEVEERRSNHHDDAPQGEQALFVVNPPQCDALAESTVLVANKDADEDNDDEDLQVENERMVERTIRRMQETSVCLHPTHAHSFQQVHFVLFKSCVVCHKRLPLYAGGGTAGAALPGASSTTWNAVVRCVACGAVAHRSCTTTTTGGTEAAAVPVCPVNRARIEQVILRREQDEGSADEPILILEQQHSPSRSLEESFLQTSFVGDTNDVGVAHDDEKWSRVKPHRGLSPTNIPTIAFPETRHLSSPISSSLRERPRAGDVSTRTLTEGDVVVSVLDDDDDVEDDENQRLITDGKENDDFDGNVHVSPLHYANHPFASISRALQENVLALHARLRSGHHPQLLPRDDDDRAAAAAPTPECPEPDSKDGDRDLRSSLVAVDSAAASISSSPSNPFAHLASQTLELVRTSVAGPVATAFVAGGAIAGGVAGLALAGPAGACAGYLGGASALGVILEGGVSIGVLVGSIAVGGYTASQVNASHQIRRQRVLTMGEDGTARKVLLVRPQLPDVDPVWDAIYVEARRSAPDALASASGGAASHNPFPSLLFRKHQEHEVILERYRRDADILHNTEEEVPTKDKVLLLVSRMLSDKSSLSGFVYRYMMDAFLDRDQARRDPSRQIVYAGMTPAEATGKGEADLSVHSSRIRRDDVHAVIRYVTATVLESRPGLGATADLTELTATAVEALIFGRLYDLVFEEIAQETEEIDTSLVAKIQIFYEIPSDPSGDEVFPHESLFVSEGALEALHLIPKAHSAVDKLYFCVLFLERISDFYLENSRHSSSADSRPPSSSGACADSLLKLTCHHIIAARLPTFNAEVAFLEEFARDEQLLRGREGYALVTLQASLHFLNLSDSISDIFNQDDDEENVPVDPSSLASSSSSSSEASVSPRTSSLVNDE
jgi:Vacuolar sorting protein 9 (VPS9) domain